MSFFVLRMNICFGFIDVSVKLSVKLSTPSDVEDINYDSQFSDENLRGLQHQLENKDLKHICNILNASQSAYIRNFYQLLDEIKVHFL